MGDDSDKPVAHVVTHNHLNMKSPASGFVLNGGLKLGEVGEDFDQTAFCHLHNTIISSCRSRVQRDAAAEQEPATRCRGGAQCEAAFCVHPGESANHG